MVRSPNSTKGQPIFTLTTKQPFTASTEFVINSWNPALCTGRNISPFHKVYPTFKKFSSGLNTSSSPSQYSKKTRTFVFNCSIANNSSLPNGQSYRLCRCQPLAPFFVGHSLTVLVQACWGASHPIDPFTSSIGSFSALHWNSTQEAHKVLVHSYCSWATVSLKSIVPWCFLSYSEFC